MPVLHAQIRAQGRAADGSTVDLPPAVGLIQKGPVVQVSINIEQNVARQLLQQGISLPSPISGQALIDTGATSTCVDDAAAQQLNLPVVDVATIASASHATTQQNVYPVTIEVVGLPITINAPRAIGVNLAPQGLMVLVGRDLLQHATFFYNGVDGSFTLSI